MAIFITPSSIGRAGSKVISMFVCVDDGQLFRKNGGETTSIMANPIRNLYVFGVLEW